MSAIVSAIYDGARSLFVADTGTSGLANPASQAYVQSFERTDDAFEDAGIRVGPVVRMFATGQQIALDKNDNTAVRQAWGGTLRFTIKVPREDASGSYGSTSSSPTAESAMAKLDHIATRLTQVYYGKALTATVPNIPVPDGGIEYRAQPLGNPTTYPISPGANFIGRVVEFPVEIDSGIGPKANGSEVGSSTTCDLLRTGQSTGKAIGRAQLSRTYRIIDLPQNMPDMTPVFAALGLSTGGATGFAGTVYDSLRIVDRPMGTVAYVTVSGGTSQYSGNSSRKWTKRSSKYQDIDLPLFKQETVVGNGANITVWNPIFTKPPFRRQVRVRIDQIAKVVSRQEVNTIFNNFGKTYVLDGQQFILVDADIFSAPGQLGVIRYFFESPQAVRAIPAGSVYGNTVDVPALADCDEWQITFPPNAAPQIGVIVRGNRQEGDALPGLGAFINPG